jgi:glycerophosphoryl diester phosphodiesterase
MTSKPLIIGHRGASAVTPENTMAAFRRALEAQADGVEFDVRLASDGIPVIIHDETLHRTGLTKGRVADFTAAQLQQMDVGSWFARNHNFAVDELALETVPTPHQLFDLFLDNQALLYLEMKCVPSERALLADAICQLLKNTSVKDRVIVECFELAAIERVKRTDPTIRTAALFEPNLSTLPMLVSGQRFVEKAKAVGADEIALHRNLARDRVVAIIKTAGLKVAVWTVDDPRWISRSRAIGIDVLITNDPAKLISQRDRVRLD